MTRTEELFLDALRAFFRQNRITGENRPDLNVSEEELAGVFRLAGEQHVFPVIFNTVYAFPAVRSSPSFPALRQRAMFSAAEEAGKSASFSGLYRALRYAGLSPLAVKGVLCRAVWPSGHLRVSSDEDLLIRDDEYPAAVRVLTEQGWKQKNDVSPAPPSVSPADEEAPTCVTENTDESWFRNGWVIELHRALFPASNGAVDRLNDEFGDPFEAPTSYSVENGTEVLSLSPEKHLLYLILHAFKHFIHSGFGIRQVCDVGLWADAYSAEIDFSSLCRSCERTHTLLFAKSLFLIARDVTGRPIPLPPEWESLSVDPAPMLADILSGGVFGSNDLARLHSAPITLDAVEHPSNHSSPLLSSLFPPREKLLSSYPELKTHPRRLPLVWVKRAFRYAKSTPSAPSSSSRTLSLARSRVELLRFYGIIE